MTKKIKMESTTIKIEVNDNGDFILLPLGDEKFILDFYKMLDEVRKKINTDTGNNPDSDSDPENIIAKMQRMTEVSDFLFERTESVFGAGTCKKVFGEGRPGVIMFWEFFNKILPFLEEYQNEHNVGLKKYNAGRTGSV